MKKSSLIIPLIFLATGFVSAYLIYAPTENKPSIEEHESSPIEIAGNIISNPFASKQKNTDNDQRISILEDELSRIKQQLQLIDSSLQTLSDHQNTPIKRSAYPKKNNNRFTATFNRRLYNMESLLRGGIEASLAETIVRRKNAVELQRLALQDRATREQYIDTPRYFDELEQINDNDISLREELGDARYDEYLYDSKQNNRIRISSVMLGSAAEQAGIQKNDIVLSYDNKNMYNWPELKEATTEGSLGEYVAISIYRKGEIFSFSVPRGPLGIQLGSTRLPP
jgi:C-terminal processing protease CtpA/Prc